jgi:hypothetical protein
MKNGTVKTFGWIVMFALLVFFVASSTSWAGRDCPDCEDSVGGCIDEILCEEEGMIDDVEAIVIDIEAVMQDLTAMGLFSAGGDYAGLEVRIAEMPAEILARLETLENDRGRAQSANNANTDEEYDDMLGQADKEKKKNCKDTDMPFYESLEGELPPGYTWADTSNNPGHGPPNLLGNGKCDLFAAEYEGVDDEGNPITVSVMVNERSENMCEPDCKGKAGQQGQSRGRFLGGMNDAILSASIARRSISIQRTQMAALRVQISELRLSGADFSSLQVDDVCFDGTAPPTPAVLYVILGLDSTIAALDVILVAGNIVTEVLEAIKDTAEPPSQQDAFGFNASSVGIPLSVAFHISKGIFGALAGVKDILGSSINIIKDAMDIDKADDHDYTNDCRKEIRDKTDLLQEDVTALQGATADLQESADQTNAKLDEMKILLEAEFARIKELLITPTGKRAGFPSK